MISLLLVCYVNWIKRLSISFKITLFGLMLMIFFEMMKVEEHRRQILKNRKDFDNYQNSLRSTAFSCMIE